MHLHVDVSDEWTTTVVEDGHLHQLGDTSIHASRIRELPASVEHWMQRVALRGAPADAVSTELSRAKVNTVDGWSASLLEIALDHPSFQRVRVVAFYRFLDYGAGAVLDVHASWYDAQRDDLIALLAAARPDWGPQDVACLANLCGGALRHLTLK